MSAPSHLPCRGFPSFEECLTHILDDLEHSNTSEKPRRLSAKKKQQFREIDIHPGRMSLATYGQTVRDLLDQKLQGTLQVLKGAQGRALQEELRRCFANYEHLLLQMTTGCADYRQALWSLCSRYFIPWAALRTAFWLRHCRRVDLWFVPTVTKGGKITSCFMQVIDSHVREDGETDGALAKRLCRDLPHGGELADSLRRDFQRYRSSEATASDNTLNMTFEGVPRTSDLCGQAVLARAIDRVVQDGIRFFGPKPMQDLVNFHELSFHHFRQLLKCLEPELPKDDTGAWQLLQSQTLSGNTPFEVERYWPLTHPYLSELAGKISSELERAGRNGCLPEVPTTRAAFGKGRFESLGEAPLPLEIERALQMRDFPSVIELSQSSFAPETQNTVGAEKLARILSTLGLAAVDPANAGGEPILPETDVVPILGEAARLFHLAYVRSSGSQKTLRGVRLLRFLLMPHRPKARGEHDLARALLGAVDRSCRKMNRAGSANFLGGLLRWLEGDDKGSMEMFLKAVRCGRASCGEDWIPLLRIAPTLAKRVSKRALNHFRKVSELEGVLHSEPSPKTKRLMNEWRRNVREMEYRGAIKPFPD